MSDPRDQLAERLQLAVHQAMDVHSGSHEMDECAAFTAALLPTVERIATERAAEAVRTSLREVASSFYAKPVPSADVHAWLWEEGDARAAALRAATETPR